MSKLQSEKKNKYERYAMWTITALAMVGVYGVGHLYFLTIEDMERNTVDLEARISELESDKAILEDELEAEREKNGVFASQIGEIASTVGKLDKLSKTDKELLEKYSKVYFLNENYIPENLKEIPPDFIYEKSRQFKIHSKVFPYLEDMIKDAERGGVELKIISAYRSFGEQGALKNNYTVTYGSGANKFSADQGYSEHQLGTTVDLTTSKLGAAFTSFEESDGYEWLLQNAHKYGFILSYPDGNAYYQYEPWHWRFVGKALAKRLYEEKDHFYDLDQRYIDNYLISIFD